MNNPFWPIIGGVLIGLSATLLMWLIGRIAGISGIVWGAISAPTGDRLWRALFIVGIIAGTLLFHLLSGRPYPLINQNYPLALLAGLIVGVGVKLGSGCTSGHGVCGIGRLSNRSIFATLTFMAVAVLTVLITKSIAGELN